MLEQMKQVEDELEDEVNEVIRLKEEIKHVGSKIYHADKDQID
jgi:hypothetical protein